MKNCVQAWKNFAYQEMKMKQTERWTVKLDSETEQLKIGMIIFIHTIDDGDLEYSQIIENLQQLYKKRLEELEEEENAHKDMFSRFSNYTDIKRLETTQ